MNSSNKVYDKMLESVKNKLKMFFIFDKCNFNTTKNKNGILKIFYEDGKFFAEAKYKNGKLDGKLIIRYPNESIFAIENYKNGVLSGDAQIFNSFGKETIRREFKNGFVIREVLFNDDGSSTLVCFKPKTRLIYNLDPAIYDLIGIKVKKFTPYEGILEGKKIEWVNSRTIGRMGEYKNDIPSGFWYSFNNSNVVDVSFWDKFGEEHILSPEMKYEKQIALAKKINDRKRLILAEFAKKNRKTNPKITEKVLKIYHKFTKTK